VGEEADLVFAECSADRVDVPRRVVGADKLDELGVVRHTGVGELLSKVDDLLTFGIVVGRDVRTGIEMVVVLDAVDRPSAKPVPRESNPMMSNTSSTSGPRAASM
jgi:hypothetical protein